MIDAGRKRPAFFCRLVAKRSGQSAAGGAACGPAKRVPANRPAYGPAFLGVDSEKGRERKRERGGGKGGGRERLFVKQIKVNKKRQVLSHLSDKLFAII